MKGETGTPPPLGGLCAVVCTPPQEVASGAMSTPLASWKQWRRCPVRSLAFGTPGPAMPSQTCWVTLEEKKNNHVSRAHSSSGRASAIYMGAVMFLHGKHF